MLAEEAHQEDDSDSLSSSSSDDYEEVDASAEDIALQSQLELALSGNPRQYDVHLQVILVK